MKGLDYVLLAGLWVESRTGYDLAQWFDKAARHFWAAHHSSIYPALAALERRGLVGYTLAPSQKGPQRKIYALTSPGQDALREWVSQAPNPAEIRDEQMVRAMVLDLLPLEEALQQLEEAKARYHAQLETYQAMLGQLEATPDPPFRALGVRLTLLRGVRVQQAYLLWCEDALELVKKSALEPS